VEQSCPKNLAYFCTFQKSAQSKNHTKGENSLNLVTLMRMIVVNLTQLPFLEPVVGDLFKSD
jgi:hypothetical protein